MTQQFTATGTYSDTSTANVTAQVTWIVEYSHGDHYVGGVGDGSRGGDEQHHGQSERRDFAGGCADGDGSDAAIDRSDAGHPTIAKGLTQQFTATGTYSDSSTANVTAQVTWNSSNTATATITAAGLATGVAVGTSNITASLSGVTSPVDLPTVTRLTG